MSESKVVRYDLKLEHCDLIKEDRSGRYVTHADYRALEDQIAEGDKAFLAMESKYVQVKDELAALRGKVRELVTSWDEFYECVETIEGPEGMDARMIAARKAFP